LLKWAGRGGAELAEKKQKRKQMGYIQGLFCNYRKYRDLIVNQVFPLF
jgi:hypothetical protein